MSDSRSNRYPALHNAMWPGLVGKGGDAEPPIDLDTMLNLTAAAEIDGLRFEGVDLFLSLPHTDIDSSDDDLARLAEKLTAKGLRAGSLVAPVWPPTGGGSAMGDEAERGRFLRQVQKACRIGRKLRDLNARQYGVIRIDSASIRQTGRSTQGVRLVNVDAGDQVAAASLIPEAEANGANGQEELPLQ